MNRALDVACAIAGLALLWPLALVIALAIRLETRGPATISQVRVGCGEQLFRCHKFRSMHVGTRERPTHESTPADITRVGGFLRKSKLDELPQLVNVVAGEMSFVGPRPCLPSQTDLIEARRVRGVYALRPGITGLAQVNGIDMSDPQRLAEVDAIYARRRGLWTDMRIALATLPFGGRFAPSPGAD